MKARTSDINLYEKELSGLVESGTLYNELYKESRLNGAMHNTAKSIASRRWNLTNKAFFSK